MLRRHSGFGHDLGLRIEKRCKITPLPSRVSVSDSSPGGTNSSFSEFCVNVNKNAGSIILSFLVKMRLHTGNMEKKTVKHALILSCFIMVLALVAESRPRYIECSDTLECGLGYCCVLGNGRYSLPRCLPLGKVNDECRPLRHPPLNVTVSYPDGESVELTHVYSTMCPCQAGLYCSDRSGFCRDPLEDIILNKI